MFKNILKTTIRSLLKNPSHSFINIFGLSIGLATVFMILLWANYHFSFDNFHQQKERIYKVMTNNLASTGEIQTSEGAAYEIMEAAGEKISGIDHFTRIVSNWRWPSEQCFKIESDNPCIYSKGIFTDSSFFQIFDITIIHGEKNPLTSPLNISLSESLAKKLYGDVNPVGKIYKIDNYLEVKVASVFKDLPANSSLQFDFIASLDVVHTLWMGKNFDLNKVKRYNYITYLTVDPNKSKHVETAINNLKEMENYKGIEYFLASFSDVHLKGDFVQGEAADGLLRFINIFLLFGLFILIMSVVNFINLATAKATIRSKEIGVRKVTGASKMAIMGQFLLESFIKVLLATILALFAVYYTLPLLNQLLGEEIKIIFNLNVVFFICGLILLSTILSGAYPSFYLAGFNPVKALKSKEGKSGGGKGVRKWLTVLQIGFSIVIIVVTTVIYLQLNFVQNKSIGYDREGVMILEPTYQHIKNYDKFRNELLNNHLIKGVGLSNANMINTSYVSDEIGWPGKTVNEKVLFKLIGGSQGLLEVFELDLLEGIGFNEADTINQILLTQSAVDKLMMDSPLGQKLTLWGEEARIVGIINDFFSESLHKSMTPTIIYKIPPKNAGTIYIRYDKTQPEASIALISEHYAKFEEFFTMKYQLLDKQYDKLYKSEQTMSDLASVVMIISILIALIGILGLSTYNVLRRYKEIGVRKVFGASGKQILALLSKDFVKIGMLANFFAWPTAWFLSNRWLDNFAYRIEIPISLFIGSFLVTVLFIILLVTVQTYNTVKMNPSIILKED